MNPLHLPWVELAIGAAIVGSATVTRIREPNVAHRLALSFTGLSLLCTLFAWLALYLDVSPELLARHSVQSRLFGSQPLRLDAVSAPLLPSVALLHFLTTLATARTHMRRYSFSWSLAAEAIRLAAFSCQEPWGLVCLLTVDMAPPYVELVNRRRPVGVYVLHMSVFATLLILGWAAVDSAENVASAQAQWGSVLLMAAILVHCGAIPAHCWVTYWFEHASLGIAVLQLVPLSGVYAAVRLALPVAPDWILRGVGLVSLTTAVYAAGMACVQRDSRRFYAFLFLSHASLVLVGLELQTLLSLTASLCLWLSVVLSLGGFGLALRALEARFGRLTLINYHGLYGHSPTLAVCFLLTGLGCVGFPFTIGFISTELLVDSAVIASPMIGFAVLVAMALNGIAVVRAYLLLFTGARHTSTVWLDISPRERISVLTLAALVLAGGLFPQPGISSRSLAAEQILDARQKRVMRALSGRDARRAPSRLIQ